MRTIKRSLTNTRSELQNFLIRNARKERKALLKLKQQFSDHWCYEDGVYRFYHQSFKVYALQDLTLEAVQLLKKIDPKDKKSFSPFFKRIIQAGASGKRFEIKHNQRWLQHTRPIVEAFLHTKYFIEMLAKYSAGTEAVPPVIPSGVAALFCLYEIR